MASSRSKAETRKIAREWLKQHGRMEVMVARPLAFYFAEQATRIQKTIERAKIASPEEFAIYFDQAKETKALTSMLMGPKGTLVSAASISAYRVWAARPRETKAFNFRLPKFIRAAIKDFFTEVRAQSWWQRIAGNTEDLVGETIKREIDRGASIPNMAKAVREELHGATKARTFLISRTEANAAMNYGQTAALDAIANDNDSIEVLSEWLAIDDRKLRPDHRKANGQQIDTSDPDARFKVGGELLRFPGDPLASAKQRVNCRCTTVAVFPGLEE